MFDKYNRRINYLRISITDRCNLRCRYCMPEEGVPLFMHENMLSFEEISEVTREAVKQGIDKIRVTGGEPLVRKGVVTLVEMLASIKGIRDFGMTTNGIFLEKFAEPLKQAGLHRLNISIDSVDPQRYRYITRTGNIESVFKGIDAAKKAGFTRIKINTVINQSSSEPDAEGVAEYARKNNLEIRFIRKMDLAKGEFWVVEGGEGGNCRQCNRLRLSSDGYVYPCLFSELGYSIKELGAAKAIQQAVKYKPDKGYINRTTTFYGLGG